MSDYKFQQLNPTLSRGKFKEALWKDPTWVAEEKLDGDRRIGQFVSHPTLGCQVRFTGRRTSVVDGLLVEKTSNVPHLSGECFPTGIPTHAISRDMVGTVLDGEFIMEGGRSKDVTSIMGSLPERAIQLQTERGWIKWAVFDCLFYKGLDVRGHSLETRSIYLRQAMHEWGNRFAFIVPQISKNKEQFKDMMLEAGKEGIILKSLSSTYQSEKLWVKVKGELTEDVVIMGYDDPKPESTKVGATKATATKLALKGWIGAVRFGQYRKVVPPELAKVESVEPDNFHLIRRKDGPYVLCYCGSCSGMEDSLREELSNNKDNYLGAVVEIKANDREPTGKFRHPRWKAFREDKDHTDCLWTDENS